MCVSDKMILPHSSMFDKYISDKTDLCSDFHYSAGCDCASSETEERFFMNNILVILTQTMIFLSNLEYEYK